MWRLEKGWFSEGGLKSGEKRERQKRKTLLEGTVKTLKTPPRLRVDWLLLCSL
jgi:hypothetical protein